MEQVTLSVLLTCYNRQKKTLHCLESLARQEGIDGVAVTVFLVDDGCTDATAERVKMRFPEVKVLQGSGNLYWSGGMRLAFGEALGKGFDYYMWLNDDVMLFDDAIKRLFETMVLLDRSSAGDGVVVGSMCDVDSGKLTYGGLKKKYPLRPLTFSMLEPGEQPIECDVANGNLVLIPTSIAAIVGNLSNDYTHGIGDFDYCLRARKAGFKIWIAPGYFGRCSRNSIRKSCRDSALSMSERLEELKKPTGLPPAREWMTFVRRHGGVFWPLDWIRTCIRLIFPSVWVLFRSSDCRPEEGAENSKS